MVYGTLLTKDFTYENDLRIVVFLLLSVIITVINSDSALTNSQLVLFQADFMKLSVFDQMCISTSHRFSFTQRIRHCSDHSMIEFFLIEVHAND